MIFGQTDSPVHFITFTHLGNLPTLFIQGDGPLCITTDIRQRLEAAGYSVWREPTYPTPGDASYPYMIENAILRSAAVIVLWSHNAASSAWGKRHILIAQRFFKPLISVRLDETSLPSMLLGETLSGKEPYRDVIAQLVQSLPAPGKTDPLLALSEQAAQTSIGMRKAAIDQATVLLQRGEHREEVLTILEYLVRNDLITSVREKAQAVLAAATPQKTALPPDLTRPQDARHLFAARCKNGHLTTFDRRTVCSQRKEVIRGLDELLLTCATCRVEMAVDVDCEGY